MQGHHGVVREWARIGHEELQRTPDHDGFLWMLKEDVKLLLKRQLVKTALELISRTTLPDGPCGTILL